MWNSGNPAAYRHENMLDATHLRAGDLFGGVSINYSRHLQRAMIEMATYAAHVAAPEIRTIGHAKQFFREHF
jgi:hypothetical protein